MIPINYDIKSLENTKNSNVLKMLSHSSEIMKQQIYKHGWHVQSWIIAKKTRQDREIQPYSFYETMFTHLPLSQLENNWVKFSQANCTSKLQLFGYNFG